MSSDWADARLEELITVKHGFAFKGEHFTDQPTAYQLVTPGNFAVGGGFQLGKPKSYSGPVPPDYILNRGDVVVTMTDLSRGGDTLGFAGVVPETPGTAWLHNQRVGLVQLKPGAPAHLGYLHYLMRSAEYRHWVVSTATGSTVKHTSPGRICSYSFKLPPLAEQVGIEAMLTALDDRIALLRETNATLEAIAQALFKSWFVDFDPVRAKSQGLAPAGMDEATAALFPDGFEESALGPIPASWSVAMLGEVTAYLNRGISPKYLDSGGIRVLNQKCVRDFAVDVTKARRHDDAQKSVAGRELEVGDVLVNSTGVGTLGRVAQILALDETTIIDSHVTVVRAGERVTWNFLGLAMMRRQAGIEGLGEGSTGQTELSRGKLATLPFVVPAKAVLRAFDASTLPLRMRMSTNAQQALTLASLRDTLLPRLISGQLRLPEAEALAT